MTAWTDLVTKTYREMKRKNPNVKLGDAMKAASKKRGKSRKGGMNGNAGAVDANAAPVPSAVHSNAVSIGGKRRKISRRTKRGGMYLNNGGVEANAAPVHMGGRRKTRRHRR